MTYKIKAYEVTFGTITKNEEYLNSFRKTVLAETALRAAEVANDLLSKKEKVTSFIQEIELLIGEFDDDK